MRRDYIVEDASTDTKKQEISKRKQQKLKQPK
jgi:hypothetical protein